MKTYFFAFISFLHLCYCVRMSARSLLRPQAADIPQLITHWEHEPNKRYQIKDSHIETYPLFVVYKDDHFAGKMLPKQPINYRYHTELSVTGARLDELIHEVILEIQKGKKKYKDFIVLQDKDFSYTDAAGLIVLRFREYPFVLKLFMESPESFVNPWCKGIEQVWFFYMGGGVNRHITGLTRLKNLEYIKTKLDEHPKWHDFIATPRKWFWLPNKPQWIHLTGHNLGSEKETYTARIPGVYAIVADWIEKAEEITLFDKHKRKIALEICNTLDLYIDPHIDNFVVEKGTNKLVLIDTEHFPTLVGLKERQIYSSYSRWYLGLTRKATYDIFFRNKKARKRAQLTPSQLSIF